MKGKRVRDIHLFADIERCKDSLGSVAPKSSVFACFGIGPPSRGLPAISDSGSYIDPRTFPLSLLPTHTHTHTHSLSLSLSHTLTLSSFTLIARFFAHSHAVTTQWTPTPIASKTGRKLLAHRPGVPTTRASFVHRHPVLVASPISPIPLKMSRSLHPFTLLRPRRPFVSVNVRAVASASALVSSLCLVTECLVTRTLRPRHLTPRSSLRPLPTRSLYATSPYLTISPASTLLARS